jgi:large subunit ribosomal protein L21
MFAVIKTGGKQYVVQPGEKVKIEKVEGNAGDKVVFDKVLLVADGVNVLIGDPVLRNAKVEAEMSKQGRDKKKIVFKYHSKTRYTKTKGHRQHFSEVTIKNITH